MSEPTAADDKVDVTDADDRLAAEALRRYQAASADAPAHPREPELLTLAAIVAGQAMMQLGVVPRPGQNRKVVQPEQARHSIDLLGILQEKTAGNRTDEENKVLRTLLTDLRRRYADVVS